MDDKIDKDYDELFKENTDHQDLDLNKADIDLELKEDNKTTQSVIKVNTPTYVLPMFLCMIFLCIFMVLFTANRKQVLELQYQVKTLQKNVYLLAMLHNNNFNSVKIHSKNNNLIFIKDNWTVDRMPNYVEFKDHYELDYAKKLYLESIYNDSAATNVKKKW